MKECPAIIAALPREIKGLVKGWKHHPLPNKVTAYSNDHAVVVCAGMGSDRATLAVQAALKLKPVTALLSVGVAGACNPKLAAGAIIKAGVVIDSRTGERFDNSQFRHALVSSPRIASVREKQRLFDSYYADAVDMEAATVARLAQAHGLYFQATKAISDEADFELADLGAFETNDGQFRELAFALHAAVRPALWSKVAKLATNSNKASAALETELRSQLEWYQKRS